MNPMFLDEGQAARPRGEPRWRKAARFLLRVGKLLFTDVFRRKERLRVEIGTPTSRFMRGLLYRALFVPAILAILVTVLVATATHPRPVASVMDPTSQGVYYDPVELLSLDNTKLEGWLVPVVDARRVLVEREDVLHRRHAAVVLVHDFGSSRQQMLPLVQPLHEAGYVLLAINLRGAGTRATTGTTFGLNEAQDVRAAVEMLRRRPFVDEDAVGVLGIGTGATAALLAAEQDPRLKLLVLDHPVRSFDDLLAERIGPRQSWLTWVRPMCKWAFEIAYKVNAEDVNLARFATTMKSRNVLMLDDAGDAVSSIKPVHHRQIVDFLKKHLVVTPRHVTTLLQREGTVSQIRPLEDAIPLQEQWPPQRSAKEMLQQNKGIGW
jgi:pimeloyl-ACP methyl ester carboxylesterase